MRLFQRLEAGVLRRLLRMPSVLARRITGPPAMSEGVALDPRTQLFCGLIQLNHPLRVGPNIPLPAFRRRQDQMATLISDPLPTTITCTPLTLSLNGTPCNAEVVRPANATGQGLVWFHGGGFVIGSLATHRGALAQIADRTGLTLVHVDYPLAPEHRFPRAHDDAAHAFNAVHALAPSLGLRPDRLAIGGDSAGANIAASVCNHLADGPRPALQILVYPPTDMTREAASLRTFAEGFMLERQQVHWFNKQLIRNEHDRHNVRLSPLLKEDLSGTPPAVVVTAGFDPLRDEGRAYARRLSNAGVLAAQLHVPDQIHGFMNFAGLMPACRRANDELADVIIRGFEDVDRRSA